MRRPANSTIRRHAAGLTLIELMLVAAILTVGLIAVASAGQYVRKQGITRYTRQLLARAGQSLSAYHALHGVYPPDRFSAAGVSPSLSHRPQTESVECLVRALAGSDLAFWRQPPFDRSPANSDEDLDKTSLAPLGELVDGWGHPLLYYHGGGARPGEPPGPLAAWPGVNPTRMARLTESLAGRWVHNDRLPLLDSSGPDGQFNNSDDERMAGPRPNAPGEVP